VLTGKTSIELEQQKVPWGDYHQKLTTSLVSGTAPDIIQVDSLWQEFFRTNMLTPLNPAALESAGIDMGKWSVDPAHGAGGEIFGIPTFTAQDIILLAASSHTCPSGTVRVSRPGCVRSFANRG
jgi:ABC-type glycerol-3-phosphate transport system substrate-binding protein